MSSVDRILQVLKSKNDLIEVANACDKAYAVGTGHPEYYNPYSDESPEKVAQNIAGLQAVLSGISIIALVRGISKDDIDDAVVPILEDIVRDNVDGTEEGILLRLANCAWGAGQPFRGGKLERATRLNFFDTLDSAEVAKDLHQIKAASRFLLNKLQS